MKLTESISLPSLENDVASFPAAATATHPLMWRHAWMMREEGWNTAIQSLVSSLLNHARCPKDVSMCRAHWSVSDGVLTPKLTLSPYSGYILCTCVDLWGLNRYKQSMEMYSYSLSGILDWAYHSPLLFESFINQVCTAWLKLHPFSHWSALLLGGYYH